MPQRGAIIPWVGSAGGHPPCAGGHPLIFLGPSCHKSYAGGRGAVVGYCLPRETGYRWLQVTEGGAV